MKASSSSREANRSLRPDATCSMRPQIRRAARSLSVRSCTTNTPSGMSRGAPPSGWSGVVMAADRSRRVGRTLGKALKELWKFPGLRGRGKFAGGEALAMVLKFLDFVLDAEEARLRRGTALVALRPKT